jgi:hypothetical protein
MPKARASFLNLGDVWNLIAVSHCSGRKRERRETHLIVPNDLVFKLLVLKRKLDVVSAPVIVEEGVRYFVLLLQAELHSDVWYTGGFAHCGS